MVDADRGSARPPAAAVLLGEIESRLESLHALRELERQVSADACLNAAARDGLLRRIAFYRSDFHARRRAARHPPGLLNPLP